MRPIKLQPTLMRASAGQKRKCVLMKRDGLYHGNSFAGSMYGKMKCFSADAKNLSQDEEVLIQSEKEGVLTLTLNRPKQRNALNLALLQDLKNTLSTLKAHPHDMSVRAVVVQSNGSAFCSGHDLKELLSFSSDSSSSGGNCEHENLFRLCSEVMALFQSIPQPTISAVHGVATAAGCQLVASTDLAIASRCASFATPGVHIGLFCSTPAVPLIRTIPQKIALDMLFAGRILSADEAMSFGLISRLADNDNAHEDGVELMKREAQQMAQFIASKSGHAMREGKFALYQQAASRSIEEAYDIASKAMVDGMRSEDADVGIRSFLTKEKAEWKK